MTTGEPPQANESAIAATTGEKNSEGPAEIIEGSRRVGREAPRETYRRSRIARSLRAYESLILTLTLIVLSIYTGFVRQQVDEMRNANAQAFKNSTDILRLSQRAWLQVDNVISDPTSPAGGNPSIIGKPVTVIVYLTNSGPTPARRVTVKGTSEVVPEGTKPEYGKRERILIQDGDVAAQSQSATFPIEIDLTHFRSGEKVGPLTQKMVDDIKTRRVRLVVYGTAAYEDVFNLPHTMNFCFDFRPEDYLGGWIRCSEYNGMGD